MLQMDQKLQFQVELIFVLFLGFTDKNPGEAGHPIQWDNSNTQWYINVRNTTNTITGQLAALATAGVTQTDSTFIKRKDDTRSLDEKIYQVRVVIPKELSGSKDPENGFVLQESSTTGVRTDSDFNLASITDTDYLYDRNTRFISTCSFVAGSPNSTVSVTSDLPHNLNVGDQIIVKNCN